jgi:hypothetical protein
MPAGSAQDCSQAGGRRSWCEESAGGLLEAGGSGAGRRLAGRLLECALLRALELGDSATVDGGDGLLHAEEEEEE